MPTFHLHAEIWPFVNLHSFVQAVPIIIHSFVQWHYCGLKLFLWHQLLSQTVAVTYTHMHISGTPQNLRMEGYDIGVHSLLFSVPSLVIGLCDNWYLLKIEVFVRVKHILVYGIMIYHLRIVLILCPFSKIIVICSFLGSITCLFALFCYQIWILSYGVELVSNKLVVDYPPPTFVAILYQWTYLVE